VVWQEVETVNAEAFFKSSHRGGGRRKMGAGELKESTR
jgi:hypothetical protein